jgi:hypothetical protein
LNFHLFKTVSQRTFIHNTFKTHHRVHSRCELHKRNLIICVKVS